MDANSLQTLRNLASESNHWECELKFVTEGRNTAGEKTVDLIRYMNPHRKDKKIRVKYNKFPLKTRFRFPTEVYVGIESKKQLEDAIITDAKSCGYQLIVGSNKQESSDREIAVQLYCARKIVYKPGEFTLRNIPMQNNSHPFSRNQNICRWQSVSQRRQQRTSASKARANQVGRRVENQDDDEASAKIQLFKAQTYSNFQAHD